MTIITYSTNKDTSLLVLPVIWPDDSNYQKTLINQKVKGVKWSFFSDSNGLIEMTPKGMIGL